MSLMVHETNEERLIAGRVLNHLFFMGSDGQGANSIPRRVRLIYY